MDQQDDQSLIMAVRLVGKPEKEQPDPLILSTKDVKELTWTHFEILMKSMYQQPPKKIQVRYLDNDDDWIELSSDEELSEAKKYTRASNEILQLLVVDPDIMESKSGPPPVPPRPAPRKEDPVIYIPTTDPGGDVHYETASESSPPIRPDNLPPPLVYPPQQSAPILPPPLVYPHNTAQPLPPQPYPPSAACQAEASAPPSHQNTDPEVYMTVGPPHQAISWVQGMPLSRDEKLTFLKKWIAVAEFPSPYPLQTDPVTGDLLSRDPPPTLPMDEGKCQDPFEVGGDCLQPTAAVLTPSPANPQSSGKEATPPPTNQATSSGACPLKALSRPTLGKAPKPRKSLGSKVIGPSVMMEGLGAVSPRVSPDTEVPVPRQMLEGAQSGANAVAIEMPTEAEGYPGLCSEDVAASGGAASMLASRETGEVLVKNESHAAGSTKQMPPKPIKARPRKESSLNTPQEKVVPMTKLMPATLGVGAKPKIPEKKKSSSSKESKKVAKKSSPVEEKISDGEKAKGKDEKDKENEEKVVDKREGPLQYKIFIKHISKLKKDLHGSVVKDIGKQTDKLLKKRLKQSLSQPAQESTGLPEKTEFVVHEGITCDSCETVITGVRYKCGNCEDFDLCEKCEARPENGHDPDHVFLKLRRPVFNAGVVGSLRVPLLREIIYRSEVPLVEEKEETGGHIENAESLKKKAKQEKKEAKKKFKDAKLKLKKLKKEAVVKEFVKIEKEVIADEDKEKRTEEWTSVMDVKVNQQEETKEDSTPVMEEKTSQQEETKKQEEVVEKAAEPTVDEQVQQIISSMAKSDITTSTTDLTLPEQEEVLAQEPRERLMSNSSGSSIVPIQPEEAQQRDGWVTMDRQSIQSAEAEQRALREMWVTMDKQSIQSAEAEQRALREMWVTMDKQSIQLAEAEQREMWTNVGKEPTIQPPTEPETAEVEREPESIPVGARVHQPKVHLSDEESDDSDSSFVEWVGSQSSDDFCVIDQHDYENFYLVGEESEEEYQEEDNNEEDEEEDQEDDQTKYKPLLQASISLPEEDQQEPLSVPEEVTEEKVVVKDYEKPVDAPVQMDLLSQPPNVEKVVEQKVQTEEEVFVDATTSVHVEREQKLEASPAPKVAPAMVDSADLKEILEVKSMQAMLENNMLEEAALEEEARREFEEEEEEWKRHRLSDPVQYRRMVTDRRVEQMLELEIQKFAAFNTGDAEALAAIQKRLYQLDCQRKLDEKKLELLEKDLVAQRMKLLSDNKLPPSRQTSTASVQCEDTESSLEHASTPCDKRETHPTKNITWIPTSDPAEKKSEGTAIFNAETKDVHCQTQSPQTSTGSPNTTQLIQNVTTGVTKAASSAFSTAKDIFYTLQLKQNEWKMQQQQQSNTPYTPPASTWTPPESKWTPPQSDYVPPQNNYVPPQSTYVPPQSTYVPPADTYVPPVDTYVPPTSTWTPQSASKTVAAEISAGPSQGAPATLKSLAQGSVSAKGNSSLSSTPAPVGLNTLMSDETQATAGAFAPKDAGKQSSTLRQSGKQSYPPTTSTPLMSPYASLDSLESSLRLEVQGMQRLVEMGFANREQNRQLLTQFDGDLEKVVQALLQEEGSDQWAFNRH